jgi:hypothetical protein
MINVYINLSETCEWEVNGNGWSECPMAGFGIGNVEILGSATRIIYWFKKGDIEPIRFYCKNSAYERLAGLALIV